MDQLGRRFRRLHHRHRDEPAHPVLLPDRRNPKPRVPALCHGHPRLRRVRCRRPAGRGRSGKPHRGHLPAGGQLCDRHAAVRGNRRGGPLAGVHHDKRRTRRAGGICLHSTRRKHGARREARPRHERDDRHDSTADELFGGHPNGQFRTAHRKQKPTASVSGRGKSSLHRAGLRRAGIWTGLSLAELLRLRVERHQLRCFKRHLLWNGDKHDGRIVAMVHLFPPNQSGLGPRQ